MKQFIVEKEYENIRLDKLIANKYSDLSRTNIQKLIDDNKITVNNKVQKASYKVMEKDEIKIEEIEAKPIDLKPQNMGSFAVYGP